ncbi:aspartyl-phosphate phosphatase Spo0E family protein [Pseudogracilibacillus sp. SO30301A]|uniref:aspartyl-phosphate phosphatase Spo0E family protein n=1 Tax=Pseudogracilibacillus sp. SO30301A TaxID=3098291 RepID=UPI00300DE7FF
MSCEKVALKEIENMRDRLAETAYDKGFTNSETVAISQRLDSMLNIYCNIKQHRR